MIDFVSILGNDWVNNLLLFILGLFGSGELLSFLPVKPNGVTQLITHIAKKGYDFLKKKNEVSEEEKKYFTEMIQKIINEEIKKINIINNVTNVESKKEEE